MPLARPSALPGRGCFQIRQTGLSANGGTPNACWLHLAFLKQIGYLQKDKPKRQWLKTEGHALFSSLRNKGSDTTLVHKKNMCTLRLQLACSGGNPQVWTMSLNVDHWSPFNRVVGQGSMPRCCCPRKPHGHLCCPCRLGRVHIDQHIYSLQLWALSMRNGCKQQQPKKRANTANNNMAQSTPLKIVEQELTERTYGETRFCNPVN